MISELFGGYNLTKEAIDANTAGLGFGAYLLSDGTRSENNRLIIKYVGRSDDLQRRLLEHLGDSVPYKYFWYRTCENDDEAYWQECEDYHLYGKVSTLNNEIHPRKPDGSESTCHVCGQ